MIWDQWATELEHISLPDAFFSSIANMCAAVTSSMCTNPTVVFGYSPLAPTKLRGSLTWLTRKENNAQRFWPLIVANIRSSVLVGCGASKGPTTKDGFTTTRSIPVSLAILHASFSADVFAYAYQSCGPLQEFSQQCMPINKESAVYSLQYIFNTLWRLQ